MLAHRRPSAGMSLPSAPHPPPVWMKTGVLNLVIVLHALVSFFWALVGALFPERVVWFGGTALVLTHVATGLLLGSVRAKRTRRNFEWGAAVCDAIGLVPVALYLANLIAARVAPNGGSNGLVRQMAHTLWTTEGGMAVAAVVLVGATALVHLVTIGAYVFGSPARPRTTTDGAAADDDDDAELPAVGTSAGDAETTQTGSRASFRGQ